MTGMRTAVVVIPVFTIAAAAGLTALDLRRSRHVPRADGASPPECGVAVASLPPPIIKPPPIAEAPPKYGGPVGDQFLGEWSDLLLAKGDGPPMLFVLSPKDLNGRYGWRMPRVARLMTEELVSVLDDGCAQGCSPAAEAARTAAREYLDDGAFTNGAARTRAWEADDAGITTYRHRLAVHSRASSITVDVTCDCASWTVGMRMWNDVTTCDAVLRDSGTLLATYQPRVRSKSNKESLEESLDAWDQIVTLPGSGMLVTETGSEYAGDNVTVPLTKTTVRTGPHWR
jgi:hypothetical protein